MREYVLSVLGAGLIAAISAAAMPSGSLKKFVSPILGLFILSVVLRPFPGFDALLADIEGQIPRSAGRIDTRKARDEHREKVIEEFERRLADEIQKRAGAGSKAYVRVSNEGEIKEVTVSTKSAPPPGLWTFIVNELGAPPYATKIQGGE